MEAIALRLEALSLLLHFESTFSVSDPGRRQQRSNSVQIVLLQFLKESFGQIIVASLSLLPVAMPFAPSSFLLLVERPGATSSVLAPTRLLLALVCSGCKHHKDLVSDICSTPKLYQVQARELIP